jgi:hypothetical protein
MLKYRHSKIKRLSPILCEWTIMEQDNRHVRSGIEDPDPTYPSLHDEGMALKI